MENKFLVSNAVKNIDVIFKKITVFELHILAVFVDLAFIFVFLQGFPEISNYPSVSRVLGLWVV